MNIFVGNLSFDATQGDVQKLFEGFGNVTSVVIVMRKEKKAPKSRGFGFVQMPDEQQSLAALAALNGTEFMGRVLDVNPARPKGQKAMVWPPIAKAKTEAQAESKLNPVRNTESIRGKNKISNGVKEKRQPRVEAKAEQYPREEREQKKTWFNPVFNKPGTYRGGRRTRSYMSRRGLDGMQEEAKPRQRSQDNPMRWRKRKDQPRPWQKSPGEHKPWKKTEEGVRTWEKTGRESKPWRKSEGGFKPWKKTEGESRPWKKSTGESKPWKKPVGDAKPWSKSSERPQKSRFKGRKIPGGYKR